MRFIFLLLTVVTIQGCQLSPMNQYGITVTEDSINAVGVYVSENHEDILNIARVEAEQALHEKYIQKMSSSASEEKIALALNQRPLTGYDVVDFDIRKKEGAYIARVELSLNSSEFASQHQAHVNLISSPVRIAKRSSN